MAVPGTCSFFFPSASEPSLLGPARISSTKPTKQWRRRRTTPAGLRFTNYTRKGRPNSRTNGRGGGSHPCFSGARTVPGRVNQTHEALAEREDHAHVFEVHNQTHEAMGEEEEEEDHTPVVEAHNLYQEGSTKPTKQWRRRRIAPLFLRFKQQLPGRVDQTHEAIAEEEDHTLACEACQRYQEWA